MAQVVVPGDVSRVHSRKCAVGDTPTAPVLASRIGFSCKGTNVCLGRRSEGLLCIRKHTCEGIMALGAHHNELHGVLAPLLLKDGPVGPFRLVAHAVRNCVVEVTPLQQVQRNNSKAGGEDVGGRPSTPHHMRLQGLLRLCYGCAQLRTRRRLCSRRSV